MGSAVSLSFSLFICCGFARVLSDESVAAIGTIAFASCNRQNKPQKHWDTIQSHDPGLFLWTGDAVYAKNNTLKSLEDAFLNLTRNQQYDAFTQKTGMEIRGIWDDHDYGVNDGGSHVPMKRHRKNLFSRYILGEDAIVDDLQEEVLERLYKTIVRRLAPSGAVVKIILLDTRSHRDDHYIPSIGQIKFPFTPLVAAALRATYSVLGFGRQYNGDVLGERQWTWLENELKQSAADFHVVISSIQILTSNPVVESWGHFPRSKQRLLSLFQKYDPRGLVLISGDVHHGELSHAQLKRESADGTDGKHETSWVEVTSSGLTHHCGDSGFGPLCPVMLRMFDQHRLPPATVRTQPTDSIDQVFIGKNFGLMTDVSRVEGSGEGAEVNLVDGYYSLKVSVVSVDSDTVVLSHVVRSYPQATSGSSAIESVIAADFPSIIPPRWRHRSEDIAIHSLLATLFISLVHGINVYFKK